MRRLATRTVAVSVCVASVGLAISAPVAGAKSAWSIAPFPKPAGASAVDFEGVSCPTAKSCVAVGSYIRARTYKTLVEHWNGSKWSVVTSPNLAGASSYLQAVSCASATRCFAVGHSSPGTSLTSLVEVWNGSSWSVMPSPSPAGWDDPALESVSCSSTTSCFAVGSGRATTGESLVEHWDGNAWSVVTIEKLTGSTETSLSGVSCPSTTGCFAVGFYQPALEAPLRTLVEQWDGTSWSVIASPTPVGSLPATLTRVSCPSLTSCYAVGSYSPPGGGFKSLVERWDGSSWSVSASPNPASNKTTMSDVSCPRTNSCVAVGQYLRGSTGKALVEGWNGTGWSVAANPDPVASTNSSLKGVACPTPTSCFAVGTSTIKKATTGLIEQYG